MPGRIEKGLLLAYVEFLLWFVGHPRIAMRQYVTADPRVGDSSGPTLHPVLLTFALIGALVATLVGHIVGGVTVGDEGNVAAFLAGVDRVADGLFGDWTFPILVVVAVFAAGILIHVGALIWDALRGLVEKDAAGSMLRNPAHTMNGLLGWTAAVAPILAVLIGSAILLMEHGLAAAGIVGALAAAFAFVAALGVHLPAAVRAAHGKAA